ncbi:hypothetical protein LINPERPRIM_LOCUS3095 [Linum perenne]
MICIAVLVSVLYHSSAPPQLFFSNVVFTILCLSQPSFHLSTKTRVVK